MGSHCKSHFSVRAVEKEEYAQVKKIFGPDSCTRKAMFEPFKIVDPTGLWGCCTRSLVFLGIHSCQSYPLLPNYGSSSEFGGIKKIVQKSVQKFCSITKMAQKHPKKLTHAT